MNKYYLAFVFETFMNPEKVFLWNVKIDEHEIYFNHGTAFAAQFESSHFAENWVRTIMTEIEGGAKVYINGKIIDGKTISPLGLQFIGGVF
jgi:hypothetical protein